VDVVGDGPLALGIILLPRASMPFTRSLRFEHLAMPWKVAVELNKILRPGGIAYFVTHQASGDARYALGLLALLRHGVGFIV